MFEEVRRHHHTAGHWLLLLLLGRFERSREVHRCEGTVSREGGPIGDHQPREYTVKDKRGFQLRKIERKNRREWGEVGHKRKRNATHLVA